MPTPVSAARQCLTPEAAHALDEAVSVARRRGHGQTTSLHAVSALLNLPSSTLRDACARARNAAYSPRLQFKALELCLSVSLDRVSAGQLGDDPPVSNSLMAAIKRSQANQRRQPENFHLYHQMPQQQQQQSSACSMSCIKVELPNLILSILDDPVVSRVFGEAGFRSSEIKLAIVRPLPRVFKFSRFKGPPLFLCNLSENPGPDPGRRSFNFPFQGYSGFSNGDEDHRRIGEILSRNRSGRNPLLVGACAYDTLASFNELLEKRKQGILPVKLSGLSVICIESDIATFVNENPDKSCIDLRFRDVDQYVEQSLGPGLVVNFGDLKTFVSNSSNDAVLACIVENLTRLLQIHGGKVWLIGAASSNETYVKFVHKFPSIEKDWALQLLPITSMPESYPRSSLMDSFVPFGGFFSMPSDLHGSLSTSCHCSIPRCQLCNEKCDQEVLAVSKGGYTASVADQYQSGLPSWLRMAELGANKGLDLKTRDDGVVLSIVISGIQKKWDNICQRLHHTQPPRTNIHHSHFPTITGFRLVDDRRKDAEHNGSHDTNALATGNRSVTADSCTFDGQKTSQKQDGDLFPMISEANGDKVLLKEWEKPSKEDFESGGPKYPGSFSNLSIDVSQASPTSVTQTTELSLRLTSVPAIDTSRKPASQRQIEFLGDISGSFRANVDVSSGSVSDHLAQSSSSSSPDLELDVNNFKTLFRALTERIGWQDEAVRVISQTISHCRMTNRKRQTASLRGDIWLNFLGPDRCGKRRIAIALAEIIHGRKDNFISADLSAEVGMMHSYMLSEERATMFRGKTVVDYVAGELCKKPASVVFLENLDKADVQAQNILSHAIDSGKFSDSYGREVGINNAIFITTSTFTQDKNFPLEKDISVYSEEKILMVKGQPMQLLIEPALGCQIGQNLNIPLATKKGTFSSIVVNKRKHIGPNQHLERHQLSDVTKRAHRTSTRNLDLNLPAQGNDSLGTEDGDCADGSLFDNSKSWLQSFFEKVDGTAVFRPYDFDTLAEKVLNEINESFQKIVGSGFLLEIDPKVIEQLLAAAYLSEKNGAVGDWVEQVLSRGFVEVQRRYNLSAHCAMKLVTFEGQHSGEHTSGVHLPSNIIIN